MPREERDGSIRPTMNEFWNGGEKILASGEGGDQHREPGEGLSRILERGKDPLLHLKEDSGRS